MPEPRVRANRGLTPEVTVRESGFGVTPAPTIQACRGPVPA